MVTVGKERNSVFLKTRLRNKSQKGQRPEIFLSSGTRQKSKVQRTVTYGQPLK